MINIMTKRHHEPVKLLLLVTTSAFAYMRNQILYFLRFLTLKQRHILKTNHWKTLILYEINLNTRSNYLY